MLNTKKNGNWVMERRLCKKIIRGQLEMSKVCLNHNLAFCKKGQEVKRKAGSERRLHDVIEREAGDTKY